MKAVTLLLGDDGSMKMAISPDLSNSEIISILHRGIDLTLSLKVGLDLGGKDDADVRS